MSTEAMEANRQKVAALLRRGDVEMINPESVSIDSAVNLEQIEAGVQIGAGTALYGAETMIGSGTRIVGAATVKNCKIGRNCSLQAGEYLESVLLDGCSTVGWARIRGNSAWEEGSQCAHNCDTKTTVLGYKTTLGSLINFCNVLMLGGTSPRLEVGAEVGSGVINFNFLPFGPTVGALIKPSTVIGSIESPFLSCAGAPVRYDFIGGHTSIIAPVVMGLNCMVAAKSRVNPGIYGDDVLIAGGALEKTTVVEVSRIRVVKDIRPKFKILLKQLATAITYRGWWNLRLEWAKQAGLDRFEQTLQEAFVGKVDAFVRALEDYGDNIAKYLLADACHSRPDSLEVNRRTARQWKEEWKAKVRESLDSPTSSREATRDLLEALIEQTPSEKPPGFYDVLAQLDYASPAVESARIHFTSIAERFERLSADL